MREFLDRLRYRYSPEEFLYRCRRTLREVTSVREFLNKFGYVLAAGIVVLAMLFSIHACYTRATVPTAQAIPTHCYLVDEETGDQSTGPIGGFPPFPGKNGKPTVVGAMKYSCDNGKTVQTLYLFKYTDAAQTELNALPAGPVGDLRRGELLQRGQMVRSPAPGSPWLEAQSAEGISLMAPVQCPNGSPAEMVYPKR